MLSHITYGNFPPHYTSKEMTAKYTSFQLEADSPVSTGTVELAGKQTCGHHNSLLASRFHTEIDLFKSASELEWTDK